MKTQMRASVEQSGRQSASYSAQLQAKSQAAFDDSRPEAAQLKALQAKMETSTQTRDMLAVQAKMKASSHLQSLQMHMMPEAESAAVQRVEEEELKTEGAPAQLKAAASQASVEASKPNNTGLPSQLKSGIESLSGMSMDHVKVHYNSSQPAQLNAHAYAQGSDIHVAPGQEQHLPHEAWHVVQQAQGRVKPTMQMKGGTQVNDDAGLESEADVMGAKALSLAPSNSQVASLASIDGGSQCAQLAPSRVHLVNDATRYQVGYSDMVTNFTGGASPGGAAMPTPASYNAQYVRRNSNGTQVAALNVNIPGTNREYHHGHMLAEALGGGGGADNIFLQDGGQNTTGAWPSWERTVANDMASAPTNHSADIGIELIK